MIPCPWKHCICTHDRGCVAGWMEGAGPAVPCPVCRPELARKLKSLTVVPGGPENILMRSATIRDLKRPSRERRPHEDDGVH